MITKCFGTSFKARASVEVMILSLSILINGKEDGFDPVAITVYFASIVSEVPSALATAI